MDNFKMTDFLNYVENEEILLEILLKILVLIFLIDKIW